MLRVVHEAKDVEQMRSTNRGGMLDPLKVSVLCSAVATWTKPHNPQRCMYSIE